MPLLICVAVTDCRGQTVLSNIICAHWSVCRAYHLPFGQRFCYLLLGFFFHFEDAICNSAFDSFELQYLAAEL